MTTVHMAVDAHDQIIRACATPELAEKWLTERVHTSHGTQHVVTFADDPLITSRRVASVGDEAWLHGFYSIITQEVLGDGAPEELSDDDS